MTLCCCFTSVGCGCLVWVLVLVCFGFIWLGLLVFDRGLCLGGVCCFWGLVV